LFQLVDPLFVVAAQRIEFLLDISGVTLGSASGRRTKQKPNGRKDAFRHGRRMVRWWGMSRKIGGNAQAGTEEFRHPQKDDFPNDFYLRGLENPYLRRWKWHAAPDLDP